MGGPGSGKPAGYGAMHGKPVKERNMSDIVKDAKELKERRAKITGEGKDFVGDSESFYASADYGKFDASKTLYAYKNKIGSWSVTDGNKEVISYVSKSQAKKKFIDYYNKKYGD